MSFIATRRNKDVELVQMTRQWMHLYIEGQLKNKTLNHLGNSKVKIFFVLHFEAIRGRCERRTTQRFCEDKGCADSSGDFHLPNRPLGESHTP